MSLYSHVPGEEGSLKKIDSGLRQTDTQTDRQTDTQTNRQADRQIDKFPSF
jgi:hypothetical protein